MFVRSERRCVVVPGLLGVGKSSPVPDVGDHLEVGIIPANERRHAMRATLMYGAGDVRVEEVPDATINEPTDAVVVVRVRIHRGLRPSEPPGDLPDRETLGIAVVASKRRSPAPFTHTIARGHRRRRYRSHPTAAERAG